MSEGPAAVHLPQAQLPGCLVQQCEIRRGLAQHCQMLVQPDMAVKDAAEACGSTCEPTLFWAGYYVSSATAS